MPEFNPAPQPPAWFTALSTEQREAWEALCSAAASGADPEEIQQRIVRFEETGPVAAAKLNAEFIGLRSRLAKLPAAEAVSEVLSFIDGFIGLPRPAKLSSAEAVAEAKAVAAALHTRVVRQLQPPIQLPRQPRRVGRSYTQVWETRSEAGLPLVNLAFGEALRYARVTGPSEELWDGISDQVRSAPSPLIPVCLDQWHGIAGTNTALQAGVAAWRARWNESIKLHDLAQAIRQCGKLRGATATNFWIDHDQARWLCIANPEPSSTVRPATTTNRVEINGASRVGAYPVVEQGMPQANEVGTIVRFLGKSAVEQALVRALENSELKPPDYLGLAVSVEEEPLTLPRRWDPGWGTNSPPALLTRTSGLLQGKAPTFAWDFLPRSSRFVLQVYLADPARLYASYRRQAGLLAGLVAASAFAALIGVLASWRAFRRQLHLNELKSNFVSSVSHELRSPIASVRLMAESLERGKVSEPPKQQEYFRFIVQECRRLSALVENVLDFSRIEQGRKQYDFEPADLLALTQQTRAPASQPAPAQTSSSALRAVYKGCTRDAQGLYNRLKGEHPLSIPCTPLVHGVQVGLARLRTLGMPGGGRARGAHTRPVRLPPTANERETGWMRQVNSAGCQRELGGTTT